MIENTAEHMYKLITFLTSFFITMVASTQPAVKSPVGVYYLSGVMETASGFKLNSDSSFHFFFSYGALDREGQGTWRVQGNQIIFDSEKKSSKDYTLVRSEKIKEKGVVIKITGGNPQINSFVHAILLEGVREEFATANNNGSMYLKMENADTIKLGFDLAGEKTFIFPITNKDHNYYEFRFEPGIMDVLFNNFKLQFDEDGFTGPHPLMTEKTFTYTKAQREE